MHLSGMAGDDIARLRSFNRAYTRVIGSLDRSYLETGFNLQEARVLYEIGSAPGRTAKQVRERTGFDQGYLSRLIARLERDGLLAKRGSKTDGRAQELSLTAAGKAAFRDLDQRADAQAAQMLESFGPRKAPFVAALRQMVAIVDPDAGAPPATAPSPRLTLREERVGDLGWLFWRQAAVYAQEFGYSRVFERYVCDGLPAYLDHYDPGRDHLWVAELDGRPVGGIAVHHVDDRPGWAKLRWFLVEAEARGHGAGTRLLDQAVAFCRDAGYEGVFLWTVDDLAAARRLYQKAGFQLVETDPDACPWAAWGHEQRWELPFARRRGKARPALRT
jgi:DNA-binding MarR family transcriptional regulator/GNAT superfamily N-acetyltransferase